MNPKTTIMKFALAFFSLTWLVGCGSASLEDHADTTPELKLETFFNGELMAYGMVLDRSGNLLRRFDVKLIATWDGGNGEIKSGSLLLMASAQLAFGIYSKRAKTPIQAPPTM